MKNGILDIEGKYPNPLTGEKYRDIYTRDPEEKLNDYQFLAQQWSKLKVWQQAEDIIAETFDQDQAQMAARKKQQQLLAQEEQDQQDELFDEALGKFGAARRSTVKNEATEM